MIYVFLVILFAAFAGVDSGLACSHIKGAEGAAVSIGCAVFMVLLTINMIAQKVISELKDK